jgi:simple sugar transport system permease protein
MENILSLPFLVGLIAATLRVATPLVYATLGEVFTERAGILNLGIEGIMFLGAFVGFAAAYKANEAGLAGYLWIGLFSAILVGIIIGLLMGFFSVTLGVNQHVSGLGITLLCTGLSLLGFRIVFGERSVLPSIDPFTQLSPFKGVPVLGDITSQYLLTYIAFLVVVPLSWWLLFRTSFGLNVRSVGENPEAVDAAGLNVFRIRYLGHGWCISVTSPIRCIHARYDCRKRLGLYRAGDLCPLAAGTGSFGCPIVRWHVRLAATLANLGL